MWACLGDTTQFNILEVICCLPPFHPPSLLPGLESKRSKWMGGLPSTVTHLYAGDAFLPSPPIVFCGAISVLLFSFDFYRSHYSLSPPHLLPSYHCHLMSAPSPPPSASLKSSGWKLKSPPSPSAGTFASWHLQGFGVINSVEKIEPPYVKWWSRSWQNSSAFV